jgi:hypothetical protein
MANQNQIPRNHLPARDYPHIRRQRELVNIAEKIRDMLGSGS